MVPRGETCAGRVEHDGSLLRGPLYVDVPHLAASPKDEPQLQTGAIFQPPGASMSWAPPPKNSELRFDGDLEPPQCEWELDAPQLGLGEARLVCGPGTAKASLSASEEKKLVVCCTCFPLLLSLRRRGSRTQVAPSAERRGGGAREKQKCELRATYVSALTNVCSCVSVVLLPLPTPVREVTALRCPARVVFFVRGHQAPRRCVRSDGLLHHLFHPFCEDWTLDWNLWQRAQRGKIRLIFSVPASLMILLLSLILPPGFSSTAIFQLDCSAFVRSSTAEQ